MQGIPSMSHSNCEPETFIPKFDANLAKCRAAAKAIRAFPPTPLAAPSRAA